MLRVEYIIRVIDRGVCDLGHTGCVPLAPLAGGALAGVQRLEDCSELGTVDLTISVQTWTATCLTPWALPLAALSQSVISLALTSADSVGPR